MLVVGLTGGLASGKSFIGRLLAERGCRVVAVEPNAATNPLAARATSEVFCEARRYCGP